MEVKADCPDDDDDEEEAEKALALPEIKMSCCSSINP